MTGRKLDGSEITGRANLAGDPPPAAGPPEPADPQRAAYISGLRKWASILEANPDVPLPHSGRSSPEVIFFAGDDAAEKMAAARRAIGGQFTKQVGDEWAELHVTLDGFHLMLYAERDAVCTRRVVGTEEREVEETVRPAETRKVIKQVEVVEWSCEPILGRAGDRP